MSALRSVRTLVASTSRALSHRGAQRTLCTARLAVAQSCRIGPSSLARQFSASARVQGEGESDVALSQKLAEELKYEKEGAQENPPDFVKEFQEQGIWTIHDVAGNDEVSLTRSFGNEQIRLVFSISDLDSTPEEEFEQDEAQGEDGADAQQSITSVPIRVSLSITKSSAPGVINVDGVCQDGGFLIENVSFYHDAKIGTDLTAEADWKRRGLYIGPQFENLDPGVQDEFEKFLEERGVNESLALFIPDYAEHKEQLEYVHWLESVKRFVEK